MTKCAIMYIIDQLKDSVTMKFVAKKLDISSTTVARVFDHINYLVISLPTVLSIDEFKGNEM